MVAKVIKKAYAVIATKGRSEILVGLMERLYQQTFLLEKIVIVGTCEQDFCRSQLEAVASPSHLVLLVSPTVGASAQRNFGIRYLQRICPSFPKAGVCIFFDDDFRPDSDWVKNAMYALNGNQAVVGLSGWVLADGIHDQVGISEAQAMEYLEGGKGPDLKHFTCVSSPTKTTSLYGCNMAVRAANLKDCYFDENLPAYSWQEDRDLTGQLKEFGLCVFDPSCRGVHLGVKGGRVSGVKFGYSQVANMLYLLKKGTVDLATFLRMVPKNIIANIVKSIFFWKFRHVDYKGRLLGNSIAIKDLILNRVEPKNIEKL